MDRSLRSRLGRAASVPLLSLALSGLVACSDAGDDRDDTGASSVAASPSTSEDPGVETVLFDRAIQQMLFDVGCSEVAPDGTIGPETDAAIRAFQAASGLEIDGEVGPETDEALRSAAEGDRMVCGSASEITGGLSSSTPPTTEAGATAHCTAEALLAEPTGLPGDAVIESYLCAEGWAGATFGVAGGGAHRTVLESVDSRWAVPAQDPCGAADASVPAPVLDFCPVS